ncbi:MAG: hypothetical protein RBU37_21500 [Myxococcota bacterium]|jgi:hypothetical protein|nr:hypothetical protein [Myxococcota bacterium]
MKLREALLASIGSPNAEGTGASLRSDAGELRWHVGGVELLDVRGSERADWCDVAIHLSRAHRRRWLGEVRGMGLELRFGSRRARCWIALRDAPPWLDSLARFDLVEVPTVAWGLAQPMLAAALAGEARLELAQQPEGSLGPVRTLRSARLLVIAVGLLLWGGGCVVLFHSDLRRETSWLVLCWALIGAPLSFAGGARILWQRDGGRRTWRQTASVASYVVLFLSLLTLVMHFSNVMLKGYPSLEREQLAWLFAAIWTGHLLTEQATRGFWRVELSLQGVCVWRLPGWSRFVAWSDREGTLSILAEPGGGALLSPRARKLLSQCTRTPKEVPAILESSLAHQPARGPSGLSHRLFRNSPTATESSRSALRQAILRCMTELRSASKSWEFRVGIAFFAAALLCAGLSFDEEQGLRTLALAVLLFAHACMFAVRGWAARNHPPRAIPTRNATEYPPIKPWR